MTLTLDLGDFWMESIETNIATLAATGVFVSPVVNFTRPGRFAGGACAFDTLEANIEFYRGLNMRGEGGGFLTYGAPLTGIRFSAFQTDATIRNIGVIAIVILRK